MTPAAYCAIVVTFRRPDSLAQVLRAIADQTCRPSLVVVADNDPEQSARRACEVAASLRAYEAVYLPVGENLGPAGGWAAAAALAAQHPMRGDWLLVIDDDDPPSQQTIVEDLLTYASTSGSGAVGLRGARFNRRRARLRRIEATGSTTVDVDYLASGGFPIYRWAMIDEVGFFDSDLFFGFEELDLGLRCQSAGWRLTAVPNPSGHYVADTSRSRSTWREYYKTRSLLTISRRHCGRWETAVTILRTCLLGAVLLGVRHRRFSLTTARWAGTLDAWRGRLGPQNRAPLTNPSKH